MSVTRQTKYLVLGLTIGLFTLSILRTRMRSDVLPIVLTGQPAPGISNARFSGIFGGASVNTLGDITFMTRLDVGGVPSVGLFAIFSGVITPVALEGQAIPDRSNLFFGGGLHTPHINNKGDIVFASNFASDAAGANFGWGVFLYSGGVLHTVVDSYSAVLGSPGGNFGGFGAPQINDNGEIVFFARGRATSSASSGLYLVSQGTITVITYQARVSSDDLVINNRGQIVFGNPQDGLSEYSNGTITPIIGPGYGLSAGHRAGAPSINDSGDVVFVDYVLEALGRGGALLPVANAVRRWRQGMVEKIAAAGDPVPGVAGATLWTSFSNPQVNQSAIVFQTSTAPGNQSPMDLTGRYENGVLSIVARADQAIPGLSATLNSFAFSSIDNKQGALMTFFANPGVLGITTGPTGIYAATTGQFPLLFPQIADGTGPGGGWRTTFIFANRSQQTNSPVTTPPITPATATVNFYDDRGAPMVLSIGGQPQSEITISVPPLGVAQFQTDGNGPLRAGWAQVQADQSLSGIALFSFYDGSGSFVGEVGDAAAVPLRSMSLFVQSGSSTATGIALANPNLSAAAVTLTLKDANSNPVSIISMTVPSKGHVAAYAAEIFGSVPPGEFQGKIDVLSTLPIVAITLRQRGSVFTSLPVIP